MISHNIRRVRISFYRRRAVLFIAAFATGGCDDKKSEVGPSLEDVGWAHYGGDLGGSKYSPLAAIDTRNVDRLEVAWLARAGDFPRSVFDPDGHRAGTMQENGFPVPAEVGSGCGRCHASQARFESTPLMQGGVLYLSTPRNRVLALDPGTGEIRWTFDPRVDVGLRPSQDWVSRGVSLWQDADRPHSAACGRRVFLTTVDARLIALDGATGRKCEDFGDGGSIQIDAGVGIGSASVTPHEYTITSPPAVVGDVVVVGSAMDTNARRTIASGIVRAYDARTGAVRWAFDPIPRSDDHPAWTLWSPRQAETTGGGNVWSIISADPARDLVFLPTASAAPNFFGGVRIGDNAFANSVVALRASTGELVWSFQAVHHDLWDYDIAAQPLLLTLRRGGRDIPAVAIGSKTGMTFVLDRLTGTPLFPIEERPVPLSDVPGEFASPTQPFSSGLPNVHGTRLTPDSAFGITDQERSFCRRWISSLRNEGLFTPPSLKGTLIWPGFWGGINWDGMAWDPARNLVIFPMKRLGMVVQLHHRGDQPNSTHDATEYMPQIGTPYSVTRTPLVAPSGVPCTPPPWGSLVALDLTDGSVRWQNPLGTMPGLDRHSGSRSWGSLAFGGPLLTGGGLVFVAATQDDMFRAFETETGALLWAYKLPAGGQAAPMTYRYRGRQYIVITAGGRAGIGSPGDWIVAFAMRN